MRSVKRGSRAVTVPKLPQALGAKKIIEYALEEARNYNSSYLGTEHILLGIVRELDSAAAMTLMNVGLEYLKIRDAVARVIVMRASNDPLPTLGAFLKKASSLNDAPPPFSRQEVHIKRVLVKLDPPVEMFSVSIEQPVGSSIQSIPTERELEWYLKGVKDGSRGTIGIPKIPEKAELVCSLTQG